MAELALVIPVLLVVLVGMFEFGRIFNYWIDTTHLANETARWAIVDRVPVIGTPGTLPERVRNYVCSQVGTEEEQTGMRVRIQFDTNEDNNWENGAVDLPQGTPLRVQIDRDFAVVPFINVGTVKFTGSATMRVEYLQSLNGLRPITWAGSDWSTCP